MKFSVVKSLLGSPIYCWYTKLCFIKCEGRACKIIYDRKAKQRRRYVLIKKHQIVTFLGSGPVSFELQVFFKTSFVNGFLYQFLNHFFQLSPVFKRTVSLIKFSVHKIIILVFKSKSKYKISAYSLPRWLGIGRAIGFHSSPFLLFLSARLAQSWHHFLDSSSRSRRTRSSLMCCCFCRLWRLFK